MVQLYIIALLLLAFTNNTYLSGVDASGTFSLLNICPYPVWPGISTGAGSSHISYTATGIPLYNGQSNMIQAPPAGWVGKLWARTHCSENSSGKFTCLTGDCGSGKVECDGGIAALPVTLAEFSINPRGMDFYDVSVVGGYNLPLLVIPQAGSRANCSTTGCVMDLNSACPTQLKVTAEGGKDVACESACAAFNQDKYCCRGAYNTSDTCLPSSYSKAFKSACPRASSYAYDDKTSTFTCAGADYQIIFCPLPDSSQNLLPGGKNSSKGNENDNNFMPSAKNGTMIYHGETDFVNSRAVSLSSTTSTCTHVMRFSGTVTMAIAIVRMYCNSPFRFM